jgi:RNA polymerase sigma factor (sigma-70 family)
MGPDQASKLAQALFAEAKSAAPYTRAAGHDEDDLVAEGLLCVGRTLASYDPDRGVPLATYFRNVVLRRRFIELGRRGRSQTTAEIEVNQKPSRNDHGREQLRREVHDVISSLLPDDSLGRTKAEAFTLYHLEGFKLRELSVRFGKSIGVIHRWIKQGEVNFRRLWLQGNEETQHPCLPTR